MLDTAGRLAIQRRADGPKLPACVQTWLKPVRDPAGCRCHDRSGRRDHVAKEFDEKVGITGIMMTRIDGDARGGAAMSMKRVLPASRSN